MFAYFSYENEGKSFIKEYQIATKLLLLWRIPDYKRLANILLICKLILNVANSSYQIGCISLF